MSTAAVAALKARELLEQRRWAEWYTNQYVEDPDYLAREGSGGTNFESNDIGVACWGCDDPDDLTWPTDSMIDELWKDDPKRHVQNFALLMAHQSGRYDCAIEQWSQSMSSHGGSLGSSAPVRKTADLAAKFAERKPDLPVTTLMLRNLPNNTTRHKLISFLDESGFEGTYDFVYLPLDISTHTCLAYAFVNFEDAKIADKFKQQLSGSVMPPDRKRTLQISSAHIQGLEANLQHLVSSAVLFGDPALRPWFRQKPDSQSEYQSCLGIEVTTAEDFPPPVRKTSTKRDRNHFERWREATLAAAKQTATSLHEAGDSSSSTAVAESSPSTVSLVEQVNRHGNFPQSRSIGANSGDRLTGLVNRLHSTERRRECEEAKNSERQESRLESLRLQIEGSSSEATTLACRSPKASDTKIDFEKAFSLMEALLKKSLPSPMPSLALLSRGFLRLSVKDGSDGNTVDSQVRSLPQNAPAPSFQSSSVHPYLPQHSSKRERQPESGGMSSAKSCLPALEECGHVNKIEAAIAEAAAAAKLRTQARIAAETKSQLSNPWPTTYELPLCTQAFTSSVSPTSWPVERLPEGIESSADLADTCVNNMNSEAAPFTPGLAVWLPKSGSLHEHDKSSDVPVQTISEESLKATIEAKPLGIEETLKDTIEAKPLGIEEWPELGGPKSKAAPRNTKDKVTKKRQSSRPKAPKRTPAPTTSTTWLVPLPDTEPQAANTEDEKRMGCCIPAEEVMTLVLHQVSIDKDTLRYERLELLAARTQLSKSSPSRRPPTSGCLHGSTLLPTVTSISELPGWRTPSLCPPVRRRVASKTRSASMLASRRHFE